MNLHDWIDELCDILDLDIELDEGLVLDLARVTAHNVARPAAPISAFLLGYASGRAGAGEDGVEALAGKVTELAEHWDRPAEAEEEADEEIPDDSAVDHTGDSFEDA